MSTLTLHFKKSKETKGTWKFDELPNSLGGRPAVGSLYITKPMLDVLGRPEMLVVIIEPELA